MQVNKCHSRIDIREVVITLKPCATLSSKTLHCFDTVLSYISWLFRFYTFHKLRTRNKFSPSLLFRRNTTGKIHCLTLLWDVCFLTQWRSR